MRGTPLRRQGRRSHPTGSPATPVSREHRLRWTPPRIVRPKAAADRHVPRPPRPRPRDARHSVAADREHRHRGVRQLLHQAVVDPAREPTGEAAGEGGVPARALRNAARWRGLAPESSHPRNAVPSCTPCAPSARAASTPRASAMPPAATTGTSTRSTICGTSAIVPVNESSAVRRNEPRWPPASKPDATITSIPARASAAPSSGVVAVPIVAMPSLGIGRGSRRRHSVDEAHHGHALVQQVHDLIFERKRRVWRVCRSRRSQLTKRVFYRVHTSIECRRIGCAGTLVLH